MRNLLNDIFSLVVKCSMQIYGDADFVIVSVALKFAETLETIVVGDDMFLMIFLRHDASTVHNRLYFHPGAKTGRQQRYFDYSEG